MKRAASKENLSSVVCDRANLKPACSATEATCSYSLETATTGILLSR